MNAVADHPALLADANTRDRLRRARTALEAVPDPEIPVVSIRELGILRGVAIRDDGALEVDITPTYSGCPAMSQIAEDVGAALDAAGAARVGPGVATYTVEGDGMIAAAAEQIGETPTPAGLEAVTVAAAPRALTTRYRGADLSGIQQAWQELVTEVEHRGLTAIGTCREVYLSTPMDTPGAAWEVDLQQPVR